MLVLVQLGDREIVVDDARVAHAGLARVPVQTFKPGNPHGRGTAGAYTIALVADKTVPGAVIGNRGRPSAKSILV